MNRVSQAGRKVVMLLAASALIGVATYGAASADTISAPALVARLAAEPTVDPAADGIPNPTVYLPIVQSDANPGNVVKDPQEQLYVFKVMVTSPADVTLLTTSDFDVLESRGPDYLLVLGEDKVAQALRAQGYQVEVERALEPVGKASPGFSPMTYFGGYRTVVEHYAHLDSVAALSPTLAVVVDYGDSWRKAHAQPNGFDLKAICITNRQPGDCALSPNSAKPRFLLTGAIHARELSTSELAWRWIDYLVGSYNKDPDITALLDYNEVWVVPVINPDGRSIVEQGGNSPYLQRKNANNTAGSCSNPPTSSNQFGVDLNRNAAFKWGVAGTSTSPCTQTYLGIAAASESEETAIESLLANLFPDQRGPNDTDAVPITATGTFVTLHSYANLVLLPWGWVECNATACPASKLAPNNAALRSLAFRMSYFNGYNTGQGSEVLYAASGTTDDWAYGQLGVAGFTFEVGPNTGTCSGFTPAYSCQDSTFWPLNRPAFLFAAKNARQPYTTPLGPTARNLSFTPSTLTQGGSSALSAIADDTQYGSVGISRPAAQNIGQAEYYVDVPPWVSGATPLAMTAQDGSFNATIETVAGTLNTAGLSVGRHTVFVRGKDSANNWGATTATWITVTAPSGPTPTSTATPTATPSPTPAPPTATSTATSTPDPNQATSTATATATPTATPSSTPTPTPSSTPTATPAGPIFSDDFETNKGWIVNPSGSDTATLGKWERGDPETTTSGVTLQLGTTVNGTNDLVTGRLAGASAGDNDVDGGTTTIRSPNITLPASGTINLSFSYYLAHLNNSSSADYLRVKVVGTTTTTVLQELGTASNDAGAWASANVNISAYAGQTVYILVEAADLSTASLVEAGIDNVVIQ